MIGEANIHSWITNGMACRISRYFTLRPDVHMPTAKASNVVSSVSGNSSRAPGVNGTRYHTIKAPNMANEIAKSTNPAQIAAPGTITRGKYTLLIKFALPTKLLLLAVTALEKKVHGRSPA